MTERKLSPQSPEPERWPPPMLHLLAASDCLQLLHCTATLCQEWHTNHEGAHV